MGSKKEVYLRFTTSEVDSRTEAPMGLFSLAYKIMKDEALPEYQRDSVSKIVDWFERNLKTPTKFSRKKNIGDRETKGVSWLKASAREHVTKLHELKTLLKNLGYQVDMVRSERPGYIVYEDDYQVVAEPFRKEVK